MYNFIVNPVSGNNKAIKNMQILTKYLTENNIDFCVYSTNKKNGAKYIASELEKFGAENIIIVGGDGTISEVINGLENPHNIKIGIIPSGTGNDFAYSLGISSNPIKAMQTILKNRPKQVDYMQGKNYRGVNVIGAGLDIEVLQKYNNSKFKNKLTYLFSLIKVLCNFEFYKFRIFVDGQILSNSEFMLVAACNGTRFGGSIKVSPYSDVKDGKINLVLIKKLPKKKIPFALLGFIRGKHLSQNYAVEVTCSNLRIEAPKFINIDGEIVENKTFELKIVPNGMNIYLN